MVEVADLLRQSFAADLERPFDAATIQLMLELSCVTERETVELLCG